MDKLVNLAEKGKIDELELAWMEAAESPDIPWPDLLVAARVIAKVKDSEVAESLVSYLLETLKDHGEHYEVLKAVEQACHFIPGSNLLRDEYAAAFETIHGKESWCEKIVDASLKNESLDNQTAIELMKKLMTIKPGAYVRKDPGARIGKVQDIDAEMGIKVNVEGNFQTIPLSAVDNLYHLHSSDIRAMAMFDTETLKSIAENDPVKLIKQTLNTFNGRTELTRIKRYLQKAVGESNWKSWWSKTRKLLEKDPEIGMTGGRKPQFFLRVKPVSRSEELKTDFDRAPDRQKLDAALQIADELSEDDDDGAEDIIDHLIQELSGLAEKSVENAPEITAESLAVMWKMADKMPAYSKKLRQKPEYLNTIDWARLLKSDLLDSNYVLDIVFFLPEWLPESYGDVYRSTMAYLPTKCCRMAAEILSKSDEKDTLEDFFSLILNRPDARLSALLWIWDCYTDYIANKKEYVVDSPLVLLRRILSAAASEGRADADKNRAVLQALNALKDSFNGPGETAVEKAAENAKDEEIRALLNLIDRNPALNDLTRKRLARAVRAVRPELFRTSTPPWETNVIYTTRKGLEKQQKIYNELINEKIPEIVKQVGEAAAFGDLSENAEYTAALEERERLSKKAAEVKAEVAKARIIPPEMPQCNHVTIGSKVEAIDTASGKEQTLTFLGPWDAEPENNVYAYNSPLALAFMGAQPGDKVAYKSDNWEREWVIKKIMPAK